MNDCLAVQADKEHPLVAQLRVQVNERHQRSVVDLGLGLARTASARTVATYMKWAGEAASMCGWSFFGIVIADAVIAPLVRPVAARVQISPQ